MKYVSILLVAVSWFVFGCVLASTQNVEDSYLWLASPLAIVASACITLTIAMITWENTKNSERTNRTIEYLLNNFPLSDKLILNLGEAQKKIIESSSSYAVKNTETQDIDFHMDLYEKEENKLSEEEASAIGSLSAIYELIFLNVDHNYFDEKIVKQHLGEDFGIQFWIRSWPYILYHNYVDQLYMNAKGINNCTGVYGAYIKCMLENESVENKYPLYGEIASIKSTFNGVIKLTAGSRSL